MTASRKVRVPGGNYVSEWFGHRVYPTVASSPNAISDQHSERCPFLSAATGEDRKCIKNPQSKGVCSVSCTSNGTRQDWLVCPYRALNPELLATATRRLFNLGEKADPFIIPAINLAKQDTRNDVVNRLNSGQSVFAYFDEKTGGELSIPATENSPEFAFDVTIIELTGRTPEPEIGRFGILEIQTTDFHGSYQHAVRNLKDVLRLHIETFVETLQANDGRWLSEGVEGPNIANVFKRTFYQMMFKFQLGQHDRCVGCVLAIPQSVWDSWQRHLGGPKLTAESDGTWNLLSPGKLRPNPCPAWVFIFDSDTCSPKSPAPIVMTKIIGTDAPSFSYWALEVAPAAALSSIDAKAGFLAVLSRRLKAVWPELARNAVSESPLESASGSERREKRPRKSKVSLQKIADQSAYAGPSENAVSSETD